MDESRSARAHIIPILFCPFQTFTRAVDYDEKWYYGNISREKAERLVLDQDKGTFLVRVSIKKKKKNCKH